MLSLVVTVIALLLTGLLAACFARAPIEKWAVRLEAAVAAPLRIRPGSAIQSATMRTVTSLGAPIILAAVVGVSVLGQSANQHPIRPVPLTKVHFEGGFWAERAEVNRTVSIPFIWKKNEETGRVDNFAIAGKLKAGAYRGQRYNDTDVYKAIEGIDHDGHVPDLALSDKAPIETQFRQDFLRGIVVLTAPALRMTKGPSSVAQNGEPPLTAVPYYAWSNRGPGEMAVWIARNTLQGRDMSRPSGSG